MNSQEFGWKIRQARKDRGLTQAALARLAGTGRRFIIDLEAGKERVELGKALKVAAALDIGPLKGATAADLARQMQIPRFWSAADNVTPDILIAGVLKNPGFHDMLQLANAYGIDTLRRASKQLQHRGEMPRVAVKETERMLRNIEEGQRAA